MNRLSAAREAALALLGALALAIGLNWDCIAHPASTIPNDTADPLLQAWELAWDGHALLSQPTNIFHANTFFPATDSLAFSDPLLGYAPLGLLGSGPTAALVRYNLLFVLVAALALWGPYLLARQLGARWPGATVAALVCGCAPWRLSQEGHLNILSTGGIALSVALLLRGHGCPGSRSPRPLLVLAGWAVAAWQVTLGFGLGLAFVMLLAGGGVGALVLWWRRGRPPLAPGVVRAELAGIAVLGITVALLAHPYLTAVRLHPEARRSVADVAIYSPPLKGLLLAPAASWVWGAAQAAARKDLGWAPEMCLLPGLVGLTLAGVGATARTVPLPRRLGLVAAVVVLGVLCLGTNGPDGGHLGFLLLHDHVPGWQGVRTPSRLVVLMLPAIALLAAGGADLLVSAARRAGPVVGVGLAAVVLVEGLGSVPHPRVTPPPAGLAALGPGPALILPTDEIGDERVMWWTTRGFPTVVNGGSGFVPRATDALRRQVAAFPDRTSIDALRAVHVRTVAVVVDETDPSVVAALRTEALPPGLHRQESGGVLIFRLGG